MLKNVYLIENIENLCLWFFSILKAVYKFSLPLNMCWIRKRCPHLPENKLCHFQFCESDNKTLKLKVLKNLKICAFDFFFIVSRSSMLFVFRIVVSIRKRCPLFLKKSVCRFHFCVSQNSSWKSKMATLSSTWRPRVNLCHKISFQS